MRYNMTSPEKNLKQKPDLTWVNVKCVNMPSMTIQFKYAIRNNPY